MDQYMILNRDMRPLGYAHYNAMKVGEWVSMPETMRGLPIVPIQYTLAYNQDHVIAKVSAEGEPHTAKNVAYYKKVRIDKVFTRDELIKIYQQVEPELGYKLSEAAYPMCRVVKINLNTNKLALEYISKWADLYPKLHKPIYDDIAYDLYYKCPIAISIIYDNFSNVENHIMSVIRRHKYMHVPDLIEMELSVKNAISAFIGYIFGIHEDEYGPVADLWHNGMLPIYNGHNWVVVSTDDASVIKRYPDR